MLQWLRVTARLGPLPGGVWALPAGLAVLLQSSSSHAWMYLEHQALGKRGYELACLEAEEIVRVRGEEERVAGAHHPSEAQQAREQRLDIACGDTPQMSLLFGQFSALSGDHMSSPDLDLIQTSVAARSVMTELLLALNNADHFHPHVVEVWRQHYADALELARWQEGLRGHHDLVARYEKVLLTAAFSSHFLQDAFAAGHGGQNRAASTPSAARHFHNHWNKKGRVLLDRAGHCWTSFGDEKLTGEELDPPEAVYEEIAGLTGTDIAAQQHAWRPLSATRLAVLNVILTFIDGERSVFRETVVEDTIPVSSMPDETLCEQGPHNPQTQSSFSCELGSFSAFGECFACERRGQTSDMCAAFYRRTRDLDFGLTTDPNDERDRSDRCGASDALDCWNLKSIQRPARVTYSLGTKFGTLLRPHDPVIMRLDLVSGIRTDWFSVSFAPGFATEMGQQWAVHAAAGFGIPLGFRYGSVAALEFVPVNAEVYVPTGDSRRQHEFLAGGLGLDLQFGDVAARLDGLFGAVHSHFLQAGGGPDDWGWAADASLTFVLLPSVFPGGTTVSGGGPNGKPPF